MATTVAVADLTIITREIITLGGNKYDSQHTQIIGGIKEVTKKIVTVPTASFTSDQPSSTDEGVSILDFNDNLVGGPYKNEDVRYLRITNLDNEEFVNIQFINSNNNVAAFKLESGGSFLYTFDKNNGTSEIMQASHNKIVNEDSTVGFTSASTTVTLTTPNPYLRVGSSLNHISGSTTLYPTGSKVSAILTTGSLSGLDQGFLNGVASFTMSEPANNNASNQTINFKYGLGKLSSIYASADSLNVDLEVFVASV